MQHTFYFRFKSAKDIYSLPYGAPNISVFHLKFEICKTMKITNQILIYSDKYRLLTSYEFVEQNSLVIIQRTPLPLPKHPKHWPMQHIFEQKSEEERLAFALRESYKQLKKYMSVYFPEVIFSLFFQVSFLGNLIKLSNRLPKKL